MYLDVVAITRRADGRLALGGAGVAVEHVVWMRRLPADRTLVSLIADGKATPAMMEALAATLAAFHAAAPTGPEITAHASPKRLVARWEENMRDAEAFVGRLLAAEDHEVLADFDEPGGTRVALVPQGGAPLPELELDGEIVFVLGSEREGLPADVLARCETRASIPHTAGAESLNVAMAGTIALYEWSRRHR